MKIHIRAGQVPGVGTGGRKFPRERGGAGMGDGAGITGRERGIGSSPQTRLIAIPIEDQLFC